MRADLEVCAERLRGRVDERSFRFETTAETLRWEIPRLFSSEAFKRKQAQLGGKVLNLREDVCAAVAAGREPPVPPIH